MSNENTNNYCACTGTEGTYHIKLNQQGPQGPQGPQGNPGVNGISPQITVAEETEGSYKLKVNTAFGSFTTPNLVGPQGPQGETTITPGKNITIDGDTIGTTNYFTFNNPDSTEVGSVGTGYKSFMNLNATWKDVNHLPVAYPKFTVTNIYHSNGMIDDTITTDIPLVFTVKSNTPQITVTNTDGNVTIDSQLEPYSLPVATSSTLGGIRIGENLEITSEGILNAVVPDVNVDGKYGICGDYSTHYGILECPNGLITNTSGKDITLNSGIVMQLPGNTTKTTIASPISKTLTSTSDIVLFYTSGELLEVGKVDYSITEPEDNGVDNYQAWFNPELGKWKLKSNDTGNVWREVIGTPIANINLNESNITRIDYIGYRILDDEIFALKSDIPEEADLSNCLKLNADSAQVVAKRVIFNEQVSVGKWPSGITYYSTSSSIDNRFMLRADNDSVMVVGQDTWSELRLAAGTCKVGNDRILTIVDLNAVNDNLTQLQNTIAELTNRLSALEANINGGNA